MKRFLSLCLAVALCLSLAACGEKPKAKSSSEAESSTESAERVYKIAAVFPEEGTRAEQISRGYRAAASQKGIKITVTTSYGGRAEETQTLAALTPQTCDGVIAVPAAGEASLASLSRVYDRGIPVALIDLALTENNFAVSCLYSSPYKLGEAAGEAAKGYIEETLKGKATVMLVEHLTPDASEYTLRVNGFLDQLKELEGAALVHELQGEDAEGMTELLDAYFKSAGDKAADVIYCTSADAAVAAHNAIVKANRIGKTTVFSVEATSTVTDILGGTENTISAISAQGYWQMGYDAMTALLDAIETGEATPALPEALAPALLTDDKVSLESFVSKSFAEKAKK